jgi:hypothetical protein
MSTSPHQAPNALAAALAQHAALFTPCFGHNTADATVGSGIFQPLHGVNAESQPIMRCMLLPRLVDKWNMCVEGCPQLRTRFCVWRDAMLLCRAGMCAECFQHYNTTSPPHSALACSSAPPQPSTLITGVAHSQRALGASAENLHNNPVPVFGLPSGPMLAAPVSAEAAGSQAAYFLQHAFELPGCPSSASIVRNASSASTWSCPMPSSGNAAQMDEGSSGGGGGGAFCFDQMLATPGLGTLDLGLRNHAPATTRLQPLHAGILADSSRLQLQLATDQESGRPRLVLVSSAADTRAATMANPAPALGRRNNSLQQLQPAPPSMAPPNATLASSVTNLPMAAQMGLTTRTAGTTTACSSQAVFGPAPEATALNGNSASLYVKNLPPGGL